MKRRGFSLIEVMVVAAMLAGLALVGMHLIKNQQDASTFAESKNEELSLLRNLQMALVKKEVCQKTFEELQVGESLTAIRASDEITLYQLGTPINQTLKINSLETKALALPKDGGHGTFELLVGIERIKKGSGSRQIKRSIAIQAEVDATKKIINCYSDVDASIQTAKVEMCQSLGGNFDSPSNKCKLPTTLNNSDEEVVSKALLEKVISELRLEFNQKLQAIKNTGGSTDVDLSNLNLKSLSTCDGPSVRFRYKEQKSTACQKEMQFRLCEDGKWGEWSGSFTYSECH